MILFLALGAAAQTTNGLSDAEIQGRKLAQQLCDARPAENFTNVGILEIRNSKGERERNPIKCWITVTPTNWVNSYIVGRDAYIYSSLRYFWEVTNFSSITTLGIVHGDMASNRYEYDYMDNPNRAHSSNDANEPFVGSDFWICDLGLEFFHWPGQKILKKENRRGRGCMVLESTNPEPSTNGYSRVVSWIDEESGGIVQAEAYDFKNKLLKEFAPKSFKKVNGQWELQDMEIDNDQTGSRTRIEFDLKKQ